MANQPTRPPSRNFPQKIRIGWPVMKFVNQKPTILPISSDFLPLNVERSRWISLQHWDRRVRSIEVLSYEIHLCNRVQFGWLGSPKDDSEFNQTIWESYVQWFFELAVSPKCFSIFNLHNSWGFWWRESRVEPGGIAVKIIVAELNVLHIIQWCVLAAKF